MIAKGEPWGEPATEPPELEVAGDDAALAAAVSAVRGALVHFIPSGSEVARAVGLEGESAGALAVPLDALQTDDGVVAVNMVVAGPAPDRVRWWHRRVACRVTVDDRVTFAGQAVSVLIANGQFLRGRDVVPRGHPGDGRAEVQAYALTPGERASMRRRLVSGEHVPHPRISQSRGQRVVVSFGRRRRLEVDGHDHGRRQTLTVTVVPAALRILV